MDLPRHLERVRADFVAQALVRTRGNQKRAGALLGLSERMIGYLIQERSLQPLVAIAQDATVTEDEALYAMRTYLVGRIGVDGWF
jgi:hypothetical protein